VKYGSHLYFNCACLMHDLKVVKLFSVAAS